MLEGAIITVLFLFYMCDDFILLVYIFRNIDYFKYAITSFVFFSIVIKAIIFEIYKINAKDLGCFLYELHTWYLITPV